MANAPDKSNRMEMNDSHADNLDLPGATCCMPTAIAKHADPNITGNDNNNGTPQMPTNNTPTTNATATDIPTAAINFN